MKIITLPNGRVVSIATYVEAWRKLKTLPPSEPVKGFSFFSQTALSVLREISFGVNDRVNIRGRNGAPEAYPSPKRCVANEKRIAKQLRETVKCRCRWCGSAMTYAPKSQRFCSASCARSYHS